MGHIGALGVAGKSEFHLGTLFSACTEAGGEVADARLGGCGEVEGGRIDEPNGKDGVSKNCTDFSLEGGSEVDSEG